jgi:hypothetical protein
MSNFPSNIDHWTLLDTIRHSNMWKMSSLEIVKKRINNKEAYFHYEAELEEIDTEIYIVLQNEEASETIDFLNQVEKQTKEIFKMIKGSETSLEFSPIGFNRSVSEYLVYSLIQRPLRKYLYYGIRNSIYELFSEMEKYIKKYYGVFLEMDEMYDLSVMYKKKRDSGIFNKSGKWQDNAIFQNIAKYTKVGN